MMIPSLISIVRELGFVRLTGTEGERDAARLFERWIAGCGRTLVRETFPIETFSEGSAEIHVGGKIFPAIPFGRCPDSEVISELIFTENPKAVNLTPEHHRGKILLSYGRPRGVYHELRDAGIAGMIVITPPYKQAWSLSHRQYEKNLIPTVTVSYDTAASIAHFAGEPCRVVIRQKTEQAEGVNLVVDIPGSKPDGSITYFVGHYDSVSRSPGASDNAGGCAVLVHLTQFFAKNPPVRDVKIIFFSGEELGLIGSQAYCKAHQEEIKKRGRLVVNVDVAGDDLGTNELYITGTKELLGYAAAMPRTQGFYCNARLSLYSSDSIPFARLGIPSVNIARYGGKGSFYGHTPDDAPSRVTARGLRHTLKTTEAIAAPLTRGAIYPVDKAIDDSLRNELETYLFGLTGGEPVLEWPPKYLTPAQ